MCLFASHSHHIYELCLKSNGAGAKNVNSKLYDFPFKVILFESKALFHPSLACFYGLVDESCGWTNRGCFTAKHLLTTL